jgi:hypothetical protein
MYAHMYVYMHIHIYVYMYIYIYQLGVKILGYYYYTTDVCRRALQRPSATSVCGLKVLVYEALSY